MLHRPQYDNLFNLAMPCKSYKCIALMPMTFTPSTNYPLGGFNLSATACDVMVGRLLTTSFHTCNKLMWGILAVCRDYVVSQCVPSIHFRSFLPSITCVSRLRMFQTTQRWLSKWQTRQGRLPHPGGEML